MSSFDPQQLANIDSSRSYIGSTQELIRKKSDLVKDLNNKKEQLIDSITFALGACKDAESVLYNRTIGSSSQDAHDRLEEYNNYLKDQHDKGSEIIGQINAAKNFDQLNRVEIAVLKPYLSTVKETCDAYARHEIAEPTPLIDEPTMVATRTTEVRAAPIPMGAAPMGYYPSQMGMTQPMMSQPMMTQPMMMSQPMVPVRPVQIQQPVQVRPVTVVPGPPVSPPPVRTATVVPLQVQDPRQVTMVRPGYGARTVSVTPVQVQQPRQVIRLPSGKMVAVSPAPIPLGNRPAYQARITHDYISDAPNTITVRRDTVVTVLKEEGDWAWVRTDQGVSGYVSRHYIR